MPTARVNGVELYYEDTGQGTPVVWSHEFGGDHRSWAPQVRHFARRHRVITYNHRGYPPSDVPNAAGDYAQDLLVEDLRRLIEHLGLGPVHLAGCSMGANVARDLAIAHPGLTRSLVLIGAGAGSANREQFLEGQAATAAALEREGMAALVRNFERLPARAAFREKDPQSEAGLKALRVPTLIMVGDQDAPCVEPSLLMRAWIPHAGLLVLPACGHTPNLEEPVLFNLHVAEFLAAVEAGRWAGWTR
jgi:pimeloyl-ACP methyl ester carboxylesterase